METLLFPTDFSKSATHAAEYGYQLAIQIQANVILCNAVTVPAAFPQAGLVVWPKEESGALLYDSSIELTRLKKTLVKMETESGFKPMITCMDEVGIMTDVINVIASSQKVDLIVMGTHGSGGLSTFLLGNHSRNMIDETTTPLLLIPPTAKYGAVKKIAFATDFNQPEHDLKSIFALIPFAKQLNAEILLTHIYHQEHLPDDFQASLERFMVELSNKADYPHIYYRMIKDKDPESGLEWLSKHGDIDMLAMIHRSHNFIESVFRGSNTQKIASHIPVPLLVLPTKNNNVYKATTELNVPGNLTIRGVK
jgi:nucleotide-binding universal stress UspA family protein